MNKQQEPTSNYNCIALRRLASSSSTQPATEDNDDDDNDDDNDEQPEPDEPAPPPPSTEEEDPQTQTTPGRVESGVTALTDDVPQTRTVRHDPVSSINAATGRGAGDAETAKERE